MSRRMIVSSAVLFFAFGLLCLTNALTVRGEHPSTANLRVAEPPVQTIDCTNKIAVVEAIKDRFRKDSRLKTQLTTLNVSFKDGVLALGGYVLDKTAKTQKEAIRIGKAMKLKAGKLAREATNCDTPGKFKLDVGDARDGCPTGKRPCGPDGACIAQEEDCTIPSSGG